MAAVEVDPPTHEPDLDSERAWRGSPVHPLPGRESGFVPGDLDRVLDPAAAGAAHRLLPHPSRARRGWPGGSPVAARQAGTVTLLDVATPGPGHYLEPLRTVLPHTDVFVPNTDEAALILGEHDPVRQALTFRRHGARRVVITLGEHGLISISDDHRFKISALPVDFVDGSGGGDAFNAGYIVGLLEALRIECLKLASAVGTSCVRRRRDRQRLQRAEADEFLGGTSPGRSSRLMTRSLAGRSP